MKKHSVVVLGLLAAIVGCGSSNDGSSGSTGGTGGSSGSSGHAGAMISAGSGGAAPLAGAAGAAGAAVAGAAGNAVAGGGGAGGACPVPSLEVFQRSDTDQSWDDNDFSDVTLTMDSCPKLASVTWPHEANWENADPSESNHEVTHFTLDSYSSVDLTNKKLSLTIELSDDVRGPAATAGGYTVSLVSVSTFDRVVNAGGAGGADVGGASGSGGSAGSLGGASGSGGGASAGTSGGGAFGGGGDGSGGTAGAAVTTETGYTEAESPVADRATLRFKGDRATVTFALPNKTAEVGSYDPTRVIKINIRIYNVFSNGQGTGGAGGAGGLAGASGSGGMAGVAGSAGKGGSGGTAEVAGASGSGGVSGGSGPVPVYDYKTSVFSISNFSIVDATTP